MGFGGSFGGGLLVCGSLGAWISLFSFGSMYDVRSGLFRDRDLPSIDLFEEEWRLFVDWTKEPLWGRGFGGSSLYIPLVSVVT